MEKDQENSRQLFSFFGLFVYFKSLQMEDKHVEEKHKEGEEKHEEGEEKQVEGEEKQVEGEEKQVEGEEKQVEGEVKEKQVEEEEAQEEEKEKEEEKEEDVEVETFPSDDKWPLFRIPKQSFVRPLLSKFGAEETRKWWNRSSISWTSFERRKLINLIECDCGFKRRHPIYYQYILKFVPLWFLQKLIREKHYHVAFIALPSADSAESFPKEDLALQHLYDEEGPIRDWSETLEDILYFEKVCSLFTFQLEEWKNDNNNKESDTMTQLSRRGYLLVVHVNKIKSDWLHFHNMANNNNTTKSTESKKRSKKRRKIEQPISAEIISFEIPSSGPLAPK
jgi:hypothetical protein